VAHKLQLAPAQQGQAGPEVAGQAPQALVAEAATRQLQLGADPLQVASSNVGAERVAEPHQGQYLDFQVGPPRSQGLQNPLGDQILTVAVA
jgi:hypothetical protein